MYQLRRADRTSARRRYNMPKMQTGTVKCCKHCKYAVVEHSVFCCHHVTNLRTMVDFVNGSNTYSGCACETYRNGYQTNIPDTFCGPEGKYWEKASLWDYIKRFWRL